MNFNGIIIGAAVFLSIGICHPLVIKMEYHWGKQCWWIWLLAGLSFSSGSLFVPDDIISTDTVINCYLLLPLKVYPAFSTAERIASSSAGPLTVKVLRDALALADSTPEISSTAWQTAASQWLQCIPSTV